MTASLSLDQLQQTRQELLKELDIHQRAVALAQQTAGALQLIDHLIRLAAQPVEGSDTSTLPGNSVVAFPTAQSV